MIATDGRETKSNFHTDLFTLCNIHVMHYDAHSVFHL